ncbi:MAG: FAD-dependent oxidoreductase [Acidimicrobiia bacterium]
MRDSSIGEARSVWHTDPDRPTYPPLDRDLRTDVVVVGGGITGLTTAYFLQAAGLDVALVEADRVGSGTTGGTTGKITSQHGVKYHHLIDVHGVDAARAYAAANQAAIETIEAVVGECGADCSFIRAPAFVYAENQAERHVLESELAAARTLDLPAELIPASDLPFPSEGALRFSDQAHFHPVRYCDALAQSVLNDGGLVFESTRATRLQETGSEVRLSCGDYTITARHAVIATLLPFLDRSGTFAKSRAWRAYGIAVTLAEPPPEGMYINVGSPARSIRPWPEGGETGMLVVGESFKTGDRRNTPTRWSQLAEWASERFDVESIHYRWSAQDYETADGLPYIGRSPLTTRTYVATGFQKWGLTNGTAGARMMTDMILGVDNPHAGVFSVGRIGGARGLSKIVTGNTKIAARFVGDRLAARSGQSLEELAPEEGAVLRTGGRSVAAYRSTTGEMIALSPRCTHLGCYVQWNAAETTWDCPCHGSRFTVSGEVLAGPATRPLQRVHLDENKP